MADAADLKSVVRKDVRVRLPPSAPELESNCSILFGFSQSRSSLSQVRHKVLVSTTSLSISSSGFLHKRSESVNRQRINYLLFPIGI